MINFLAALDQLGRGVKDLRTTPPVQPYAGVDAQGMPIPMMQALPTYGADVLMAGNTGMNPRLTNAQREQMAGLGVPGTAPTIQPTFVPGSQSQFSGYTGAPRGRPMPPAEMLRKR